MITSPGYLEVNENEFNSYGCKGNDVHHKKQLGLL